MMRSRYAHRAPPTSPIGEVAGSSLEQSLADCVGARAPLAATTVDEARLPSAVQLHCELETV